MPLATKVGMCTPAVEGKTWASEHHGRSAGLRNTLKKNLLIPSWTTDSSLFSNFSSKCSLLGLIMLMTTRTATKRAALIKCLLSVRHVSEHLKPVYAFVLTARLQDGYRFLQHIYQRRNGGPRCWATCQSRSHRQSDSSWSSSPVCCVILQERGKWCFLYAVGMFGLFTGNIGILANWLKMIYTR